MIPFKDFYYYYVGRRVDTRQYREAVDMCHAYSLACELSNPREKTEHEKAIKAQDEIRVLWENQVSNQEELI